MSSGTPTLGTVHVIRFCLVSLFMGDRGKVIYRILILIFNLLHMNTNKAS